MASAKLKSARATREASEIHAAIIMRSSARISSVVTGDAVSSAYPMARKAVYLLGAFAATADTFDWL